MSGLNNDHSIYSQLRQLIKRDVIFRCFITKIKNFDTPNPFQNYAIGFFTQQNFIAYQWICIRNLIDKYENNKSRKPSNSFYQLIEDIQNNQNLIVEKNSCFDLPQLQKIINQLKEYLSTEKIKQIKTFTDKVIAHKVQGEQERNLGKSLKDLDEVYQQFLKCFLFLSYLIDDIYPTHFLIKPQYDFFKNLEFLGEDNLFRNLEFLGEDNLKKIKSIYEKRKEEIKSWQQVAMIEYEIFLNESNANGS